MIIIFILFSLYRRMIVSDPIFLKGLAKWCKQRGFDAMQSHSDAAIVRDSMGEERISHLTAVKSKSFKRSRITPQDWEVDNDMAIRDICISMALRRVYIRYHMWDSSVSDSEDFYAWLMLFDRDSHQFEYIIAGERILADYRIKSPAETVFCDRRNILNSVDVVCNPMQMTSGYVPPYVDYRSLRGKNITFGFPKPIFTSFSTVPADEATLRKSEHWYRIRKEVPHIYSIASMVDQCYAIKFMRNLNCSHEIERGEDADLLMCHLKECYQLREDYVSICKSYTRMWFLNKVPEFNLEYNAMFAKWQRKGGDVAFFICKECDESYVMHDYKNVEKWDTLHLRKKMESFCSFHCFNQCCMKRVKSELKAELAMLTDSRVFCSACQNSCFIPPPYTNDVMDRYFDSWRHVNFGMGAGGKGVSSFYLMAWACSDECQLFMRKKLGDKNQFILARNSMVKAALSTSGKLMVRDTCGSLSGPLFRFYTCFSCTKVLHPGVGKICHFRNFPRLQWAYTCHDADCIAELLHTALPVRALFGSLVLESAAASPPTHPSPLDRIEDAFAAQKHMSSESGRRFTLSIFE